MSNAFLRSNIVWKLLPLATFSTSAFTIGYHRQLQIQTAINIYLDAMSRPAQQSVVYAVSRLTWRKSWKATRSVTGVTCNVTLSERYVCLGFFVFCIIFFSILTIRKHFDCIGNELFRIFWSFYLLLYTFWWIVLLVPRPNLTFLRDYLTITG